MVITVTLNPAVDRLIQIEHLHPGQLHRVQRAESIPGGKGINVARVIKKLGGEVLTMGLTGGDTGKMIKEFLAQQKIKEDFTRTEYPTRINLKIRELEQDRETEINEFGQSTPEDFRQLKNTLKQHLPQADLLVLSGSLPRGLSQNCYSELIGMARDHYVRTILDTSGKPLQSALAANAPFLIKPNLEEVKELLGAEIGDRQFFDGSQNLQKELMNRAIDRMLDYGVNVVVISMGSKGTIIAAGEQRFWVKPPTVDISKTTVGAGDSLVAGLALKIIDNEVWLENLGRYATAVATAFVRTGEVEKLQDDLIREIGEKIEIERI